MKISREWCESAICCGGRGERGARSFHLQLKACRQRFGKITEKLITLRDVGMRYNEKLISLPQFKLTKL